MELHNILFVGVGGQGVLLASEVLAETAMNHGLDVKKSEVHGMAQRGGIVSSHVRYGQKVFSPLIKKGEADFILAFEEFEALRWLNYINDKGRLIVNRQKLVPPVVYTGKFTYPANPFQELEGLIPQVYGIDGLKIADALGNAKLVSIVLLGALSVFLDLPDDCWLQAIRTKLPERLVEQNLAGFKAGRKDGPSI